MHNVAPQLSAVFVAGSDEALGLNFQLKLFFSLFSASFFFFIIIIFEEVAESHSSVTSDVT